VTVPGETVNRLCASGMNAVVNAARAASLGDGDLFIAGGVEHMHHIPMESGFDPSPRLHYRHSPATIH